MFIRKKIKLVGVASEVVLKYHGLKINRKKATPTEIVKYKKREVKVHKEI